ncbi:MAG TPA: hypothetical protein VJ739_04540, partial [Gemmataceae bacterium]|nr:hypothetical protein [Gemmataceae bacterium]
MTAVASIFLDFNLPNAATWFYLSLLLAVALFFKFSRLLSVRNLDVVTLFLLVPGLLLLLERPGNWVGYLWLLLGSGYFLLRCLFDLTLVRRPALAPNLNLGGLAWLAAALFGCLVAVAYRQPHDPAEPVGRGSAMLDQAEGLAKNLVDQQPAAQAAHENGIDVDFAVGRSLAVLCHLAVVAGLIFVGCRHFQDTHAGMAAATFYLLLPFTAYHIGQWQEVWPLALVVWAVGLYRRPMLSGLLLGLATGTAYFPALAFPLWCSFYWRRGAGRFAATFLLTAAVCLAVIGSVLWLDGELPRSLQTVFLFSGKAPWITPRAGSVSFWTGVHWAYCLPVIIAYAAFVVATAFWPHPKNLAHLLALTAAVFLGIQFWYPDQGGVYVLWYLPLLLLLVF